MVTVSELTKYYTYVEDVTLELARRTVRWHKLNGDPHIQARYLVETSYRIINSSLYYNQPSRLDIDISPIQPGLTYLKLLSTDLDSFLTGDLSGSDIIKKGGTQLWEDFNRGNPLMDVFSDAVAKAVKPLITPESDILELGGGVGGTTTMLAEDLKRANSFMFTDIKTYFLDNIQTELPELKINTSVLDLKKPPKDFGKYDIIYATNVVHVVTDIETTLRWAYDQLKPGGKLIIGEGSPYAQDSPWPLELMFAMFSGWIDILRFVQRPYPGWLLPNQWLSFFGRSGIQLLKMEIIMDEFKLFGGVYTATKN